MDTDALIDCILHSTWHASEATGWWPILKCRHRKMHSPSGIRWPMWPHLGLATGGWGCALGLPCFRQIYGLVKAIAIASRIHYEGTTIFLTSSMDQFWMKFAALFLVVILVDYVEISLNTLDLWTSEEHKRNMKKQAARRTWACLMQSNALPLCLDGLPWQCRKEVGASSDYGKKQLQKKSLRLQPSNRLEDIPPQKPFSTSALEESGWGLSRAKDSSRMWPRPAYTQSHGLLFSPWHIRSCSEPFWFACARPFFHGRVRSLQTYWRYFQVCMLLVETRWYVLPFQGSVLASTYARHHSLGDLGACSHNPHLRITLFCLLLVTSVASPKQAPCIKLPCHWASSGATSSWIQRRKSSARAADDKMQQYFVSFSTWAIVSLVWRARSSASSWEEIEIPSHGQQNQEWNMTVRFGSCLIMTLWLSANRPENSQE